MKKIIQLLIILHLFYCPAAFAGWSESVRLTYRRFEMEPQVAARNDTVHVVWQQIAGPQHISYMRSIDSGNSWSNISNLEDSATHYGARQDLCLTPDYIFVGWEDLLRDDPVSDIGLTYSATGDNWHSPGYVFGHHVPMYEPGVASFQDSIYAVYHSREHDSTGNNPLRFLYSSDMGFSWSQEVTVGYVSEYTNFLHVAHCRNSLYVVWASTPAPLGGIREVIAVVSHDGGQTWSDAIQLSSPDSAVAQHTCIACDEVTGNFAVGWMDYGLSHGFPGDLYLRITTDGGYTWLPESHATTHHGVWSSSLSIVGDSLWAVWADRSIAYGPICFSKSTDLGVSWSPYEQLTFIPADGYSPTIAYDNGKLHVVWYNDNATPDSGLDIYYKSFDPEVDAIEHDILIPKSLSLSVYPNPFNSATTITLTGAEQGEIGIYDITGRLITTLHTVGGQALWDAIGVSSGIYFARLAGKKTSTIKLVLLK